MAAHTSAGKTVVAEYAIALSLQHLTRWGLGKGVEGMGMGGGEVGAELVHNHNHHYDNNVSELRF